MEVVNSMKKLLLFILIYIVLNIINLFGADNIIAGATAYEHNDSITVKVKIINKSQEDIYVQNQFWEILENDFDNNFLALPGEGYLVNSICVIPKKYSSIRYKTERCEYPYLNKIEEAVVINVNDSINFTIIFSKYSKISNEKKIFLSFPYLKDFTLLDINAVKHCSVSYVEYLIDKIVIDRTYSQIEINKFIVTKEKYKQYLSNPFTNYVINKICGRINTSCIIQK